MSLLSPWGLLWLVGLPVLVAFYLFRPEPRRRLSTTFFLWKQSVPESQGGVYAKRLRSNPLLLLQLLVLALLALYLARPASSWSSLVPASKKVVLVVDRSASMTSGGAFDEAVEKAEKAIDGLFGLGNLGARPEVMLIASDREPRILVPFTHDPASLRRALDELRATDIPDRLESLRPFLASLISDQKASVWLFGDHLPAELELPGIQFTSVGQPGSANAGIEAFSVELSHAAGSAKPLFYARLQNYSESAVQRLLRLEKMSSDDPSRVESVLFENSVLMPAGEGRTLSQPFPAARLSSTDPSLFRVRLLPMPGGGGGGAISSDTFLTDDVAFTVAPPYGRERMTVSVAPGVEATFLLRALLATRAVEVLDWAKLASSAERSTLDLGIVNRTTRLPSKLVLRTRFVVTEAPPAKDDPVEVLSAPLAAPPLVRDTGVEWSRLRVQRDARWKAGKSARETVLLSAASGPALVLSGVGQGEPALEWRFPLAYSSLPLSPALPILVNRFVEEYSRPTNSALLGSLTTSERRTRPSGSSWRGAFEIQRVGGSGPTASKPETVKVAAGEPQFPRLGLSGFYKVQTPGQPSSRSLAAVNLFSASEGALPHTEGDRSFSSEGAAGEAVAAKPSIQGQKQYREFTTPLALLSILLLLAEAAVFLRRGRP